MSALDLLRATKGVGSTDTLVVVVEAAEDQARADHEAGTCSALEWPCSLCEPEEVAR